MNTYLQPLRTLNSQLVAKAKQQQLDSDDINQLREESTQAEKRVLNALLTYPERSQQETFLNIQLHYVQELDNELFQAAGQKEAAKPCFDLYKEFARRLYRSLPGLEIDTLLLSDSYRTAKVAEMDPRWHRLCNCWKGQRDAGPLLTAGRWALRKLADLSVPYALADYEYLQYFLEELEHLSLQDKADSPLLSPLAELMIRVDYNSLRFFGCVTREIRRRLEQLDYPEDRAAALLALAADLPQLAPLSGLRFWQKGMPLHTRLLAWITEELKAMPSVKIRRNLTVDEQALLEKLMFEEGATQEENLEVLARKLSLHFSSKMQDTISDKSLSSKFSTKDTRVYFSIQKLLKNMLEKVNAFLRENGFPNEGRQA